MDSNKNNIGKVVVFDFSDKTASRYYVYLLFCFDYAGYKIYLRNNIHFFGNLTTYASSIAKLRGLRLLFSNRSLSDEILITNRKTDNFFAKKVIRLSVDVYGQDDLKDNILLLPFLMIPRLYYSKIFENATELRGNKRNVRIFFSGNVNPEAYNHKNFNKLFKKLTRIQILDIIRTKFSIQEVCIINEIKELKRGDFSSKFVLSEWVRLSLDQKKIPGRTQDEDWLSTLSLTDFFLCCPGITQPMCHNLIEAMSVGTIPVLEHPEYLNPPLCHGVNCIVFSGEEDLIKGIKMVLTMNQERIREMRSNVIEYYDSYLKPHAIVQHIEAISQEKQTAFIIESSYFEKLLNKL